MNHHIELKTLNLMLDILGDRNIALCREITKNMKKSLEVIFLKLFPL